MPKKLTQEEFLAKAVVVHGVDRYDYSQAVYSGGNKRKVKIICKKHGPFEQTPNNHINGSGCTLCAYASRILKKTYTKERFINKANLTHNSFYDYSQVKYVSAKNEITIICPEHGAFKQPAGKHMDGHGCHTCGQWRAKQAGALGWIQQADGRLCTLYFLRIFGCGEEFFKVGVTSQSIKERYRDTRNKYALKYYQYEVLAEHQSDAARVWDWEQSILESFSHLKYKPKISFGGESECFSSCEEILAIFPL